MSKRKRLFWIVCLTLLVAGVFLSLYTGSVDVPFAEAFGSGVLTDFEKLILFESRLPRTVTAILAGAGLSMAGLLMQTMFRNPLAGPSVLGISSGASLAVAIVAMGFAGTQLGSMSIVLAAVVGSISVLVAILWVARKFSDISTVLIVGLMVSFFTSSIVSLIQSFASESSIKAFVFWGFGSFSDVELSQLPTFGIPILLMLVFSPFLIKGLNALLMGELHTKSMGIDPRGLQFKIIVIAGIAAGVVTAFCGPIAFVGLTTPHLARIFLKTADHRIILPASIVLGSVIALFCDILARMPGSDMAIPLNTVCAFMGAPVVIYLIVKGRKQRLAI